MKHLYLIGGPMGVGKTTVGKQLKTMLDKSAFLDGDWCWDIHPFTVSEETKALVTDNIVHLLSGYLRCSAVEHVVFCWVMHEQQIIDGLLARLPLEGCCVHSISLLCTQDVLRTRLQKDIDAGIRTEDVLARSLSRMPMYEKLRTFIIDTSQLTPGEAARIILDTTKKE